MSTSDIEEILDAVDAMVYTGDALQLDGPRELVKAHVVAWRKTIHDIEESLLAESEPGLVGLIKRFHRLQIRKNDLEAALKQVNIEYDRMRMSDIPEAMAEGDVRTMTVEGAGRISLTADVYVSYSGKEDEAFEWLNDNGFGNVIKETANSSSLKAIFRQMIRDGKPLPDEVFKITPFTRASLTKA